MYVVIGVFFSYVLMYRVVFFVCCRCVRSVPVYFVRPLFM